MGNKLVITVFVLWALAFAVIVGIRVAETPAQPVIADLPAERGPVVSEPLFIADPDPAFRPILTVEWDAGVWEETLDRLAALEQQWAEHDKQYHFTCDYEDCLSVDELLNFDFNTGPTGYDGRDR